MSDMSETARKVLELARPGHDPPPAAAARVHAALSARLLAQPALLQAGGAAQISAKLSWAKVLSLFGAGGAIGLATVATLQLASPDRVPAASSPEISAPRSATTRLAVHDTPAAPPAVERAAVTDGSTALVPPAVGSTSSDSNAGHGAARTHAREKRDGAPANEQAPSSLDREIQLLRSAQQALHAGAPAQAIVALDALDRAVPAGALLEERAATRAVASCLSRGADAASEREFAERFPSSVHLARVARACSETK